MSAERGPAQVGKVRSLQIDKSMVGLVVVPHRGNRKLSGCFGSKIKRALDVEAQFSKTWPSLLVELYPHLTLTELKSPTYITGASRQGIELS